MENWPVALVLCGSSAGLGRLALPQQSKALEGEREPGPGVLVVEAAAEQLLDAG